MKLSFLLIAAILVLTACSSTKSGKKRPLAASKYMLAYNIRIPDTARDDWEILTMNTDGSNKKNITNNADVAWIYYAYKNRLFFISDRDTCYRCFFLYEMDADGKNIKKVADLRLEDSWMSSRKNGEELIVTGRIGKETRYQLFLVNTVTGKYNQLTSDTAAQYGDPCFSPDGKEVVFSYKKNKRDKKAHEELYLMKENRSDYMQLTHYPENNPSATDYGYRAGAPRWHPTENFISYISKQDGRHSIFAITTDGKKQWKLIDNKKSDGWHDWSSDGKWLAFNISDNEERQFHINLMNWTTKEQKQLTDTTYKSQLAPVFIERR